jgi:TonB family protein
MARHSLYNLVWEADSAQSRARVWIAFAIGFFALCVMLAASASRAVAATEFCPAKLVGPHTKSSGQGSAVWYYRLTALGPRVVEGTIIADTDAGWFTWNQRPVQLTRTTYTMTAPLFKTQFAVAGSPELSVSFPQPVAIRDAWVTKASTHGDENLTWNARGEVTCDLPDFAGFDGSGPNVTQRTPNASDPTPAPAPPMAPAVASSAPFPPATCAQPFRVATVTKAAEPSYPQSLQQNAPASRKVSVIYVAVDPHGQLADAWLFASSGYPAMDAEALNAARRSQYLAPISYCRPVGGTYLFAADFEPN